jgi:hypothetical protein
MTPPFGPSHPTHQKPPFSLLFLILFFRNHHFLSYINNLQLPSQYSIISSHFSLNFYVSFAHKSALSTLSPPLSLSLCALPSCSLTLWVERVTTTTSIERKIIVLQFSSERSPPYIALSQWLMTGIYMLWCGVANTPPPKTTLPPPTPLLQKTLCLAWPLLLSKRKVTHFLFLIL